MDMMILNLIYFYTVINNHISSQIHMDLKTFISKIGIVLYSFIFL